MYLILAVGGGVSRSRVHGPQIQAEFRGLRVGRLACGAKALVSLAFAEIFAWNFTLYSKGLLF